MLLILRGKPGTGKSTISDEIARRLKFAVIDKDDIKDCIDDAFPDFNTGGLSYEAMLRLSERNLKNGLSVICDSPLTFPDLYERSLEIAERHGHEIRVVRLICRDADEWKSRINNRKYMPDHRAKDFSAFNKNKLEKYEVEDELLVDTSREIEVCINDILAFCREKSFSI